jgi:hypothetical protein
MLTEVANPDDKLPEVPTKTSTCYQLFGRGAGCTWNHDGETSTIDQGWSAKHEAYDAYGDYSADVTMFGNGCDDTVLKCKGKHSTIDMSGKSHNYIPYI